MLKVVALKLIKNAIAMALTKKVALWAVKLAVHQTENKIDDNVVDLLEGCYDNDSDKVMKAVEKLVHELKN